MPLRLPALLALAVLLAPPIAAHELWIETRPAAPRPGDPFAVALRVGDGLAEPHPVRREERRIRRFVTLGADGERPVLGADGADPAGLARAGGSGELALVAYESDAAHLVLDAARFEAYLRADGLDRVARLRAARGESAAPGRERYSRCAKALVRPAGAPVPAAGFDRVAGLALELVAERDPAALAGEALPVRLLFRGAPLGGALVVARRLAADGERTVAARTGDDGRARLALDEPAFWLVGAVHMLATEEDAEADWRSWWASLTFDSRPAERE
jgi:hypothetical protein